MNELIEKIENITEKKVKAYEIKKEIALLLKMLKNGFDKKDIGVDKIINIYTSENSFDIERYYKSLANQLYVLELLGKFNDLSKYLKQEYGIDIDFSVSSPYINYKEKSKKFKKFVKLYENYYLDSLPTNSKEAMNKIINSIFTLKKEYKQSTNEIKTEQKEITETEDTSPITIKTIDKILTSAKIKTIEPETLADVEEDKISLQIQGIQIIKNEYNS